jgi:hypothetical protein
VDESDYHWFACAHEAVPNSRYIEYPDEQACGGSLNIEALDY